MNQALHNGNTIEYYDSMADVPIDRFVMYNYMLSVDAGLGSDMDGVNAKIDPLFAMLDRKDYDSIRNQLINMKQNMAFVVAKQHPKMMSFAALVERINGQSWEDQTEEGLMRCVKKMGAIGISWGTVKFLIDQVKKKYKKKQPFTFLI